MILDLIQSSLATPMATAGFQYTEINSSAKKSEGMHYAIELQGEIIDKESMGSPTLVGTVNFNIRVAIYNRRDSRDGGDERSKLSDAFINVMKVVGGLGQSIAVEEINDVPTGRVVAITGWEAGTVRYENEEVGRIYKFTVYCKMHYVRKG